MGQSIKKAVLIAVILTLGIYSLKAQNKLSIAAGVNFSSVSSRNSTNPDGKLGLNAGIAYKYYMSDLGWFVKAGLFYSQEGWLHKRIDFLNLPIVVGFDFTDDFNFNFGLQYGYILFIDAPKKTVNRNNAAFLIGFEFYPTEFLEVGLRFANGLRNILNEPVNEIEDARTSSIQFYFGFNLGKKEKKQP